MSLFSKSSIVAAQAGSSKARRSDFIRLLRSIISLSLPKVSIELTTSFIVFVGSLYFTVLCQKYSNRRRNDNVPLPDILHTPRLDLSSIYKITDIPINVYIFLLVFKFNKHLSKFLWTMSLIYFVRALSFSVTTLPKCGKMKDKDNTRSCSAILRDYITLKDTHIGHNNDLLPSGHVCFSTLFVLYTQKYGYLTPTTNRMVWVVNIVNSILIILSRCHYSIDVFYAYVLTYMFYKLL